MQKKDSLQKMLSFRRGKEKQRRKKIISSALPSKQECSRRPPDDPETAPEMTSARRETVLKSRPSKFPSARWQMTPAVAPKQCRETVPIDSPSRCGAATVDSPRVYRAKTRLSVPPTEQDGTGPVDRFASCEPHSKPQISIAPAQQPKQDVEEEEEAGRIFMAAAALDCAGNHLCERGEYDSAITSYTRALELKQQSLKSLDSDGLLASVATSINNIGYLRQRSGAASTEESMAAYRDSLKIKREVLGESHLSVGKTLNNIGSVHYSCRDFENALQAYHEAKNILECNLGATHEDVATVHSNIGDVYLEQGEMEKAHDQYKEALNIRWMHFDEHDPKVIRLLEKIAGIEMDQSITCSDEDEADNSRVFDEEEVPEQLHNLSCEVEADIKDIADLQRKMALDMVKDKLHILKGMRNINIENDTVEEASSPRSCKTPLSNSERSEALSSVKERLASLRARKAMGESSAVNRNHDQDLQYGSLKLNMGKMLDA